MVAGRAAEEEQWILKIQPGRTSLPSVAIQILKGVFFSTMKEMDGYRIDISILSASTSTSLLQRSIYLCLCLWVPVSVSIGSRRAHVEGSSNYLPTPRLDPEFRVQYEIVNSQKVAVISLLRTGGT